MEPINVARAIGGLLSVTVLLGLLGAHVVVSTVTVEPWVVGVMLTLIGGLLAVDVTWQNLPSVKVSVEDKDE